MQMVETQIDNLLPSSPDDDRQIEDLLAKKEERIHARKNERKSFRVTLPIVPAVVPPLKNTEETEEESRELAALVARGQEIAVQNAVGMSLRQVSPGRKLSELALDVDTLRFQSFVDELQGRTVMDDNTVEDGDIGVDGANEQRLKNDESIGSIQVLQNSLLERYRDVFDGVVVSSVARGGLAWQAGVRAGDVLMGTSATLGNKLWPKSTLDGVRSAISSRKVLSSTMEFEFRRLGAEGEFETIDGVKAFELNLSRPIGINVEGERLVQSAKILFLRFYFNTSHIFFF